jgi:hypothetical protein
MTRIRDPLRNTCGEREHLDLRSTNFPGGSPHRGFGERVRLRSSVVPGASAVTGAQPPVLYVHLLAVGRTWRASLEVGVRRVDFSQRSTLALPMAVTS